MTIKDIKRLYVNLNQDTVITDKRYCIKIVTNYVHISYRHYGSSAIRHNLKDFIWLMKTIFEDYKVDDLVMLDRQAYYEESSTYWKEEVKAL
jgi:hypothetical protein